ncbi:hypothetical protein Dimus_030282, partial [Dionaea muscipula]
YPNFQTFLKDLEQVHNTCTLTLKAREDEWNSKIDRAIEEVMSGYKSDLKSQDGKIHQLQRQFESCHSSLEASGEEISILLMLLGSCGKDREEKIKFHAEHLEMIDCTMMKAQTQLQKAHEEISSLALKIESFRSMEIRVAILENELEESRKKLEESLFCQLQLREQVSVMEATLEDVSSALDKSNSELTMAMCKVDQAESELQTWKSTVEGLTTCLEQYQQICHQTATSIICQVETKECHRRGLG